MNLFKSHQQKLSVFVSVRDSISMSGSYNREEI